MFFGICLGCTDSPREQRLFTYKATPVVQEDESSNSEIAPIQETNPTTVMIGPAVFTVQVAENHLSRAKGLSGQLGLPDNHGMLFVFESPSIQTFWMKDMLFPIDIVWISDTCLVDSITPDIPIPLGSLEADKLPKYQSNNPVKYVLEITQGQTEIQDIKAGDPVSFQGVFKIPIGCR